MECERLKNVYTMKKGIFESNLKMRNVNNFVRGSDEILNDEKECLC